MKLTMILFAFAIPVLGSAIVGRDANLLVIGIAATNAAIVSWIYKDEKL